VLATPRKKRAGARLLGVVRVDAARLFGLAAACFAVWTSHAAAATPGIGVNGVPKHVVSGTVVHVTATTRTMVPTRATS
jgi:hypothetical protein